MDAYQKLKLSLVDTRGYTCQGAEFWPHACQGGIECHHVLYDRQRARGNAALRKYADNPINIALLCHVAHDRLGHNRGFRAWWKQRAGELYGEEYVQAYIDGWPTKIGRR